MLNMSLPVSATPKVSVIVPNYNHARYLVARLDSIFAQTFHDFEVIILDDVSTDDSMAVIAPYLSRPGVRFYPNEENSGSPFSQWRRGIDLAHGEYVLIAESDDIADPQLLETLVPMLDANLKLGIAYCQSYCIDSDGACLGDFHWWTDDLDAERWRTDFSNAGGDECGRYLLWKNTIPNASAVLFRRAAYELVDARAASFRLCGDWLVWISMLRGFDIAYTSRQLNYFRKHQGSIRNTTSASRFRVERWVVQRFVLRHFKVSRGTRRRCAEVVSGELLEHFRSVPVSKRKGITRLVSSQFLAFFVVAPLSFTIGAVSALAGWWQDRG